MIKLSSLSFVLPCYNEEENIEQMVIDSVEVCSKLADQYEIIVVNDGSKDKSLQILEELVKRYNVLKVINQSNTGYGGAIKRGFTESKMDWIFFTDSDRQFNLNDLYSFIPFTSNFKFIFGYREKRADSFHRILIAKMLKVWNKLWLGFPLYIKDIDCAFKLMHREDFERTYPIISSGGMVNSEFILKIHKLGYQIKQIPVHHYSREKGQSTGSNPKVILRAIKETFILREAIKKAR